AWSATLWNEAAGTPGYDSPGCRCGARADGRPRDRRSAGGRGGRRDHVRPRGSAPRAAQGTADGDGSGHSPAGPTGDPGDRRRHAVGSELRAAVPRRAAPAWCGWRGELALSVAIAAELRVDSDRCPSGLEWGPDQLPHDA